MAEWTSEKRDQAKAMLDEAAYWRDRLKLPERRQEPTLSDALDEIERLQAALATATERLQAALAAATERLRAALAAAIERAERAERKLDGLLGGIVQKGESCRDTASRIREWAIQLDCGGWHRYSAALDRIADALEAIAEEGQGD